MKKEPARPIKTFYTSQREIWRAWLGVNYETEPEIWFLFPMKASGEPTLSYNDAVEEALCFGWIDSTITNVDALHRAQRFSPRRAGSSYSRANIERLIWLEQQGLLLPDVRTRVLPIIRAPYVFPPDILDEIERDGEARVNYERFPDAYKRIRIAYIDAARNRPAEFRRRLDSFLRKTRQNKLVGYGGIDKYYKMQE